MSRAVLKKSEDKKYLMELDQQQINLEEVIVNFVKSEAKKTVPSSGTIEHKLETMDVFVSDSCFF